MKFRSLYPLTLSLLLSQVPLIADDTPVATQEESIAEVVSDNTAFGLSLYSTISSATGNAFFSPYSVFSCLSMVYAGARNDTAIEMAKTLKLTLPQGPLAQAENGLMQKLRPKVKDAKTYQLNIANGMWLDKDTFVLSDFRHTIEDSYDAKLQVLDFVDTKNALFLINDWTMNQTQGKIKDLLHPGDIDSSTRLVLTNAVYFKGNWVKAFDPVNTAMGPFWTTKDKSTQVKMMEQTGNFDYFENDDMQLLSLPFMGGEDARLACLFLLPKTKDGIAQIEKNLSANDFKDWMGKFDFQYLNIKIPQFTITQRYDLNDPLKSLGMNLAFGPKANFSGINGMKDLYLSKVVHEAFFAIDEVGVTAAAATGAAINVTSVLPKNPPVPFVADHPFLFMIVDRNTGTLLFMGKLQQP